MTDESERHDWYKNANKLAEIMANIYEEYNMNQVVGVIAALSPRKTWEQNLVTARELLMTGDCGHMRLFVDKAKDILECDGSDDEILDILNGNKIQSFYLNIMYYDKADYVTIDRHALSIALGYRVEESDYKGMTSVQYAFFVQCYTLAAMKVGVSPLRMQSATWVKWRKIKQQYKKK